MSYRSTQMRNTIGEFDPKMFSRNDVEFYYSAAATMTNLICIPEGGFKRAPGSLYADRLHRQVDRDTTPVITTPNGGTGANANDGNTATTLVTTTNISTIDPYIVVHYDLGSPKDIAFIDTAVASLTTATNNTEFFIQVSTDAAAWTSVGAAIPMSTKPNTVRRRVRGTYRYIRFARIGATDLGTDKVTIGEFNSWTETADVSESETIDFEFNTDETYKAIVTDKNIAIYQGSTFQADVRSIQFDNDKIALLNWVHNKDKTTLLHGDVPTARLIRHDDTIWTFEEIVWDYVPKYNYDPAETTPAGTMTPSAVDGKITLTASVAATFVPGDVGQFIEGNGGRARIETYTSGTVVKAITVVPFFDIVAIATGNWTFEKGWEDTWSVTRGYPRAATYSRGRFWVAGSKGRPTNAVASRIGLYNDFNPGSLRDTDAIDIDLELENAIVNVIDNKTLQFLTTKGESAIIQSKTLAPTPSNPGVITQTNLGSEPGLRPVIIEGATVFVQKGGKSIGSIKYSEVELSHVSGNLSMLSSHLIQTPVDLKFRKTTNTEEASYLLIVNSNGNLTFGCMLIEQDVKGFTSRTTNGTYTNAGVDGTVMYAVVQREIDSIQNKFLEIFDFNCYTDSAIQVSTGLPTDTFVGLDHLEGEECRIRADGYVLPNQTVVGGTVTLDRDVTTLFEIGLNFDTEYKTLPYSNPEQAGDVVGKKKRVHEVILRLYETAGIKVNDNVVLFREFGVAGGDTPLDTPPPVFTGDKKISGIIGWDKFGQVTITQTDPLPMTVLGITTRVRV